MNEKTEKCDLQVQIKLYTFPTRYYIDVNYQD